MTLKKNFAMEASQGLARDLIQRCLRVNPDIDSDKLLLRMTVLLSMNILGCARLLLVRVPGRQVGLQATLRLHHDHLQLPRV